MPIGVLPVASPSTACPPARRRSLMISAMRRAIVRAISSYSTMTRGTRSLEDGISEKERSPYKFTLCVRMMLVRFARSGPRLGLEYVPDCRIFRAKHPHRESTQAVPPREIHLLPEAARVLEKDPFVHAAVREVGVRHSRHAVPLHCGTVPLGNARAPRPADGLAPRSGALGNGAVF